MILHTYGHLIKEEKLISFVPDNLPNTLILESIVPFPGYHGANLPDDKNPEALYFILTKFYSIESVFRLAKKLQTILNKKIDLIPGEIEYQNSKFYCLRIRNYPDILLLADLVNLIKDEGYEFMKSKKIDVVCLIDLQKPFILEEIEENIYKDVEDKNMFYLQVPRKTGFSLFRRITTSVKNNIENRNFDAAIAYIYWNNITDLVRIYSTNIDTERLIGIRNFYLAEHNKYTVI